MFIVTGVVGRGRFFFSGRDGVEFFCRLVVKGFGGLRLGSKTFRICFCILFVCVWFLARKIVVLV